MRVLFLTDNFPPETNAPANRTWEHAREWVRMGHEVTVLTSVPNYPLGKPFAGYRNRPYQKEQMDGITVIRVWTYMAKNEGFVKRTIDQASYMVSSFLASLTVRKPDVVIATSPQFFTVVSGWAAATFKRRPFVFELRDLWPETIAAVGAVRSPLALRLLEKLAWFLYRKADLVVPVTNAFKQTLVDGGIHESKITVVTNGVNAEEIKPRRCTEETRRRYNLPVHGFVASYVGTLGMCHGLKTLVEAAELSRGDQSLHYAVMGEGADKETLRTLMVEKDLNNVTLIDGQPRQEAIELLAASDVSLVLLKNSQVFRTVIPSKLFESMVLKKPIVLGVLGESRRIVVEECGCGLGFPPENAAELVQSVRRLQSDPDLRRDLGERGYYHVQTTYQRRQLAERMITAVESVCGLTPRTVEHSARHLDVGTGSRRHVKAA